MEENAVKERRMFLLPKEKWFSDFSYGPKSKEY
jgi:hypothetical protein